MDEILLLFMQVNSWGILRRFKKASACSSRGLMTSDEHLSAACSIRQLPTLPVTSDWQMDTTSSRMEIISKWCWMVYCRKSTLGKYCRTSGLLGVRWWVEYKTESSWYNNYYVCTVGVNPRLFLQTPQWLELPPSYFPHYLAQSVCSGLNCSLPHGLRCLEDFT